VKPLFQNERRWGKIRDYFEREEPARALKAL
jgi:hypothetical protein